MQYQILKILWIKFKLYLNNNKCLMMKEFKI